MTDETTTRTRRRVRARPSTDHDNEDRTRTRSRGTTDGAPSPSTTTTTGAAESSPASRRRRVRKREVGGGTDDATGGDTGARDAGGRDADAPAATAEAERREGSGTTADQDETAPARTRTGGSERGRGGAGADAKAPRRRSSRGSDTGGRSRNGGGRKKAARDDAADAGRAADDADRATDADAGRAADDNGGRSRKQKNRKGRRKPGGAPRGGVSEETRRAITEGPPRRMLVSVGKERTEVAVLEERDLVEHYVTRKENESYVGNIYLGRVQNVLPGMEAAFVDIGKGRNGVLYAGEVNYDDEDVESKAPRIEQALKPGQTVVVQVTKDPMGTKGARLTQQLSLAGRYCVLAVEDGTVGISRKLTDSERDRLRDALKEIKPDGYGLIVRTAASGATREQLEADVKRLVHRWEQVQQRLEDAKPLAEVYREPELAMRVIRDVFGPEYVELICDDRELSDQIEEYLDEVSPDLKSMVTFYDDKEPLFDAYEITNQVRRALEKKVWLASGGYLIIEKTEA
ncbi:MAG TPA: ribonuclease E/G, partial [Euzebyales bacterium]|nr:ribonuclease E/G [Euzebyales bacterium]